MRTCKGLVCKELAGFDGGSTSVKAAIVLLALTALSGAAKAEDLPGAFHGLAYGVNATGSIGPVKNELRRVAGVTSGCAGTDGRLRENEVDGLRAGTGGRFLRAGSAQSTALTNRNANSARARLTANVAHLNLFNGLITAGAITAVAQVDADASHFRTNATGSGFQNLSIAGKTISSDVAPNSQIAVAGLGTVTLKRIVRQNRAKKASISIDMLRVVAGSNNGFGLPVGAEINVAHAVASFNRAALAKLVGGGAYFALAESAGTAADRIGKLIPLAVPCEGTNGKTVTASIDAVSIADLLQAHNAETTVFGGMQNGAVVVRTTAAADHVSLLGGLIQADVVKAVAQDKFSGGTRHSSAGGTSVAGLVVGGAPRGTVTAPNVRVNVNGVGYLVVNETRLPKSGTNSPAVVRGLHLFVTEQNVYGLAVGGQIIIAQASGVVHPGGSAQVAAQQ